jgi:pilus assembly protein CpaB
MRLIILLGAALAAMAAAILVRNMAAPTTVTQTVTDTQTVIKDKEVSQVKVLVSRRDLAIGDRIATGDLEWAPWPEAHVVEGYSTETENADAIEKIAGSVVRIPIYNQEPILKQKLVLANDTSLMAALLAPGMRAISVEISTESASGGFILPNDKVDVILTHEIEVQTEQAITERAVTTTIIKNVRVLAIDQVFRPDENGGSSQIGNTATLEVSAKEAELVALSQRMGTLSLSLRPWSDSSESMARDSRTDMLEIGNPYGSGHGGITIYKNGQAASAGLGGN